MMRALLKDQDDSTLMVINVMETTFDPEKQDLYLYVGETCYTVHGMTQVISDSLSRELYEVGKADFSMFMAELEK